MTSVCAKSDMKQTQQIKSMKPCPLSNDGKCVILCPFCEGRGYVSDAMYNTLHAEIVEAEN